MKKSLLKISIMSLCAVLMFTACKKDKETDDTSEQSTNGGDDSRVQVETDNAINDIDASLSSNTSTMRVASGGVAICGATVDSSSKASGILVLNYDGTTVCNGRTRSGSITVHLLAGAKWSQAGATASITFTNYKITRTSDSKSITFNGTKYYTNVSSGSYATLMPGSGSLVHKIRSNNMSITFDDGTVRTWNIARTRTITCQTLVTAYTISTAGDTTIAGNANVAAWGTTRQGSVFYSIIQTPIVWNSGICSTGPVSGVRILKGISREITITYGVDLSGNAVTGTCPYGAKLNWTNIKNVGKQAVISY